MTLGLVNFHTALSDLTVGNSLCAKHLDADNTQRCFKVWHSEKEVHPQWLYKQACYQLQWT